MKRSETASMANEGKTHAFILSTEFFGIPILQADKQINHLGTDICSYYLH